MSSNSFDNNSLLSGDTQDLAEELFHLANRKPWQSGLYSKLLVKADDLRVLLIAMEAGAKMKEHHLDGTTVIQVLRGVLCLRVQDKSTNLQVGQILTLAPGVKHDVEARNDSAFLVTIAWPDDAKLQSLSHKGYRS